LAEEISSKIGIRIDGAIKMSAKGAAKAEQIGAICGGEIEMTLD